MTDVAAVRSTPRAPLVLTVNAGSSSVKFSLFAAGGELVPIHSGTVEALATQPVGSAGVVRCILDAIAPHLGDQPLSAIAHRVVHGGERFDRAVRVTSEVIGALHELIPLAPNHLPDEIALIEEFAVACPLARQVSCFDTAFYRELPLVSRTVPVPETPGLRRYGFHGLSYTYLLSELERLAGTRAARGRVVLAHLGNGASMTAVRDGRPMDTSMGMTPAGGLIMSSRSGDLDPGIVTYLARTRGLSVAEVDEMLTRQSGLLAISGFATDMRELLAAEEARPRARLAVDAFCYQVTKWTGAFAAALGGLDVLVFSGGIGEHAPAVRERVCNGLEFLGLKLDDRQNRANAAVISDSGSRLQVRVIPTDEAVTMVREALTILGLEQSEVTL